MTIQEINTELDYMIAGYFNVSIDDIDNIPMDCIEILRSIFNPYYAEVKGEK